MKAFRIKKNDKQILFQNLNRRPDKDERDEVLQILKDAHCEIGKPIMGPDCDLYECMIDGEEFYIVYTIDGEGTFLHAEQESTLLKLEKLF